MANDLVVKLLLKTGTFSTDLKTAKGQIQNFQSGCKKAGDSLSAFGNSIGINIGSLTKFGGVVGAAALAGKELKNILMSSQSTADGFNNAIAGCKGVVDSLHTALATCDFSAFRNGLWSVFDAAKAVSEALDKLGNTQIAYNYMSKENAAEFDKLEAIYKNPKSTQEQKDAAIKRMQEIIDAQVKYAENYGADIYDVYKKKVVKKAGEGNISVKDVTLEQFRTAMRTDLGEFGDPTERRKWYQNQYETYLSKIKKFGDNNIMGQEKLKKKYADAIAIHAMLELMKDDELKELGDLLSTRLGAKQSADQLQKRYNEMLNGYINSKKTTTTTPKPVKTVKAPEVVAEEGSLKDLTDKYNKANNELNLLTVGTEEWLKKNKEVNELNTKLEETRQRIKEINGEVEKVVKTPEGSLDWISEKKNEILGEINNIGFDDPDSFEKIQEYKKQLAALNETESGLKQLYTIGNINSIKDLEEVISLYKELRDNMMFDNPEYEDMVKLYNDAIDDYTEKLNKLKGVNTEITQTTSVWDGFSQSMANVSTVVSSLTNTFKSGAEITASSVLSMVATCLPAVGQLISSLSALTAAEAVEAGVSATQKAVSTSKHWIEAIAAVASLGAVVAAAISSAKNAGNYANGGIVGGSSFRGDRMTANVNSGEMILNRTQQYNLFKQLNGQGGSGSVEFHISGDTLVGVLNNHNRKNRLIR